MSDGLILNVTALGLGMHPAAWRHRDGPATSYFDPAHFREVAQLAEHGLLHAVFLADTLAVDEENFERPNLGAMDPGTVLAYLAAQTRHVGLVGTASTTYSDPFGLARRFMSLDHLSGGRAAWNVVTTFVPAVAANFGRAALPEGPARYARAEEFVDVVKALWLSWEEGALVGDKASGRFADAGRVRPLDHKGEHFDVRGPLTLPRSPQTHPLLFQAGASAQGRELAARTADVVFTAQNTLAAAREFRADIRQRARAHGRAPDDIKVLPGLLPILGGTQAEARARKEALDTLGGDAELKKLALRVGLPPEDLALDAPLPLEKIQANTDFRGSQGFRDAAVRLALEEGLTVRELLYRNGGGHQQVVGTPQDVADMIATWHAAGAADGFNLMIDALPDGLHRFVESVVPLLQRRGLFHTQYAGNTLRENLGLTQ
ncbi:Nitrilotriacetate monooxygenase component A [plant metagenome]|uniref:Nitrilotriacetate monooxygenase component A n=1 Tax=plant metagenome TaxID=1297885 RepID=A0A484XZT1_9ZZZZ